MNSRALVLLFALFLAIGWGCGGDGSRQQRPPADWTRLSNDVIVRIPAEPGSLHPVFAAGDNYASQVFRHLRYSLMYIDPHTGDFSPLLVKGKPDVQEIASGPFAGGISYTYEMLPEATWDNGDPITGEDYAFCLKAILNPKVPAQRLRVYFENIRDVVVDAANPRRFTVITDEPYILAEEAISGGFSLFPAYVYDPEGLMAGFTVRELADSGTLAGLENDPRLQQFADLFSQDRFNREPEFIQGCGPYQLESWESGQRLVLRRKANWWGDKLKEDYPLIKAYPSSITYRPVRDNAAAATMVKDEQLDIAVMIDSKDFVDFRDDARLNGIYEFYSPSMMAFYMIYINTRRPELSDRLVRRALAHAVNVEEIIETVFFGLGQPTVGPIHPSKDYYRKDLPLIRQDFDKARSLLREAGWEDTNNDGTVDKTIDGQRLEMKLDYLISNNEVTERLALLVKDAAQRIGIELNIVARDFQNYRTELNNRNFDIAGGALQAQPILDDLVQIWHTESDRPDGFNRMGFGNAESDALIEEVRHTLDKQRRDQLYREFQQIVYDEQPVIFLMAPQGRILVHKRFDSFTSVVNPGYFPELYPLQYEAPMPE